MVAVWIVRWVKLAVRVIMTAEGRKWYRKLKVMLKIGRAIAVGSSVPTGLASAMMMYCIKMASMMKRRMARRFLGVVQLNMRRFRGWVTICFITCYGINLFVVRWG